MISVITITYNRKEFLQEAIVSVLGQTYSDFEYLIVDDGSTDGTEELLKTINDPRIKYIRNEHTGYLSVNRNTGLDNAVGEIITFLDSDDYWDPAYLAEIAAIYRSQKVNSVITNAFIVEASKKVALMSDDMLIPGGNLVERKLKNSAFKICSCCFSFCRKINLRFNEDLVAGDNDFYMRILTLGNTVLLPKKLAYIRRHSDNMSDRKTITSSYIQAYEEEFVTLKYLLKMGFINRRLYYKSYSKYLYTQASNYKKMGLTKEARARFGRSFMMYPLHLRSLLHSFFG